MLRLAALLLALSTAPALADAPKFSDYPGGEIYAGKVAKPVLDTEDKRMFRTRINEAAKGNPDFGGHFIVARWGCGASCVSGAVIDAKTGVVTMVPFAVCCTSDYDTEPITYRADSRLIVFTGLINEEPPDARHYYEFADGELKLLTSEKIE
jgi:hypothetical protein